MMSFFRTCPSNKMLIRTPWNLIEVLYQLGICIDIDLLSILLYCLLCMKFEHSSGLLSVASRLSLMLDYDELFEFQHNSFSSSKSSFPISVLVLLYLWSSGSSLEIFSFYYAKRVALSFLPFVGSTESFSFESKCSLLYATGFCHF